MPDPARLVDLSPDIDLAAAADAFSRTGRARLPDVLTPESARATRDLLEHRTPWGLAWRGGSSDPEVIRAEELPGITADRARTIQHRLRQSMADGEYAFCYSTYPLVQALLERWAPGGPHEQLLTELNSPAMLDLVRAISGIRELVKADGQATLYRPGHFLARHDDGEPSKGRRVAYVLNLCGDPDGAPWRPEFGGMLQFLTHDGRPKRPCCRGSTRSTCSSCPSTTTSPASPASRPRRAFPSPAGSGTGFDPPSVRRISLLGGAPCSISTESRCALAGVSSSTAPAPRFRPARGSG